MSLEAYEKAIEAFDTACAEREEARANPHWALPIVDPKRRRAQRRFDAAVEAVTQAGLACDAARRALEVTPIDSDAPGRHDGEAAG
jgi:hypothetical protein